MSDVYEFKIWAEGEARDAAGRLLDTEGNPITEVEEQEEEPSPDEVEL